MPGGVEIKGQRFQDSTGLAVKVDKVDADHHRLHSTVIGKQENRKSGTGEMSYVAFFSRFTRIESVEDVREACARIKNLGYAAANRVRIYGEEFELFSNPFPQADGIAIHVKRKRDSSKRTLRFPVTFVQGVMGRRSVEAA